MGAIHRSHPTRIVRGPLSEKEVGQIAQAGVL